MQQPKNSPKPTQLNATFTTQKAPCVSGDTEILTHRGYFPIKELVGQEVNVWNGSEFSAVIPEVTGKNQDVLKVTLSDNKEIKCTHNHSWILANHSRVEAKDLKIGAALVKTNFPVIEFGADRDTTDIFAGKGKPRMDYSIASRLQWLAHIFSKNYSVEFLMESDPRKSKIIRVRCVDNMDLMDIVLTLNTLGIGDYSIFNQHDVANLRLPQKSIDKLKKLGIPFDFEPMPTSEILDGLLEKPVTVIDVKHIGKMDKVYCFTETKNHSGIFSGVLLGNCG